MQIFFKYKYLKIAATYTVGSSMYIKNVLISEKILQLQGLKLLPAGRQCDWKLSVGNQNFKASRQEATNFQRLVNVLNRRSRN